MVSINKIVLSAVLGGAIIASAVTTSAYADGGSNENNVQSVVVNSNENQTFSDKVTTSASASSEGKIKLSPVNPKGHKVSKSKCIRVKVPTNRKDHRCQILIKKGVKVDTEGRNDFHGVLTRYTATVGYKYMQVGTIAYWDAKSKVWRDADCKNRLWFGKPKAKLKEKDITYAASKVTTTATVAHTINSFYDQYVKLYCVSGTSSNGSQASLTVHVTGTGTATVYAKATSKASAKAAIKQAHANLASGHTTNGRTVAQTEADAKASASGNLSQNLQAKIEASISCTSQSAPPSTTPPTTTPPTTPPTTTPPTTTPPTTPPPTEKPKPVAPTINVEKMNDSPIGLTTPNIRVYYTVWAGDSAHIRLSADYGHVSQRDFDVTGNGYVTFDYTAPSEVPPGGKDTITATISDPNAGGDKYVTTFDIRDVQAP